MKSKILKFVLFLPLAYLGSMILGGLFTLAIYLLNKGKVIEAAKTRETVTLLDAGEIVFGDSYGIVLAILVYGLTLSTTAWWVFRRNPKSQPKRPETQSTVSAPP
ncbi:MAG: hypothetical protein JJU29_08815 [Verrucomicrobia bacterium]|nr:hypothetical protein [Verrucomicrobiota bacterium]MCH8511266.1 hypothetical protein [Kiritimatiellia bacterium]